MSENIRLTPIQIEYKKLLDNTETVHLAAVSRLTQNKVEILALEREASELEDVIENTRETMGTLKVHHSQ